MGRTRRDSSPGRSLSPDRAVWCRPGLPPLAVPPEFPSHPMAPVSFRLPGRAGVSGRSADVVCHPPAASPAFGHSREAKSETNVEMPCDTSRSGLAAGWLRFGSGVAFTLALRDWLELRSGYSCFFVTIRARLRRRRKREIRTGSRLAPSRRKTPEPGSEKIPEKMVRRLS